MQVVSDALFECVEVPLRVASLAAQDQLDRWVQELESLRPLVCLLRIVLLGHHLDLPRAPGLVAEGPVLHVVRLFPAVLATEVGVVCVSRRVAVLEPCQSCKNGQRLSENSVPPTILLSECDSFTAVLLINTRLLSAECLKCQTRRRWEASLPSSSVPASILSISRSDKWIEINYTPVPKFKARYGSVPTRSHHFMNSSVPNWLLSDLALQASSGRFGRLSFGPTPSIQWYVATKLPPG